jgi:predicted alpha/beta superfamily hydrolase
MGSSWWISFLCLFKIPSSVRESGIFSPSFWFSDKIFDLTENTKKIKAKFISYVAIMKVKYGYRPKQNGIPIKHKAMLLFEFK